MLLAMGQRGPLPPSQPHIQAPHAASTGSWPVGALRPRGVHPVWSRSEPCSRSHELSQEGLLFSANLLGQETQPGER